MEHRSLVDIPEGQLVEMLLKDPYWKSTLFGLAGFPAIIPSSETKWTSPACPVVS
jgi:hypothetical protein